MSVSVQSPSSAATSSPTSSPPSTGRRSTDASLDLSRPLGSSILSPPTATAFSASFARPSGATQQITNSRTAIAANPSAHADSRQTQGSYDFLDRIRAQSVFVPSGSNPSPSSPPTTSPGPSMMQLDRHRKSLPASSFSQSRIAQLALLADQAKMAATGTSSLRVARANNLFVDEAVRQAAGQVGEEAGSDLSPGDVGELLVDPAWEAAFSSPGFLASASSLAHEFKAQEQSRKEWAGQALALQHRRWTMAPESSLPAFGPHKRPSPSSEKVDPIESIAKRRRVSFDQRDLSFKNRRVSFAKNLMSPSRNGSQMSPSSGAASSSALGSGSTSASTAPTALSAMSSAARSPPAEFKSALPSGTRRRSSLSSPPESRPQLLANVIASFATLLDTRQQACASLAELARTSDGAMPALSPTSSSRPPSPPIGAASLFPNSTGDMSAIAESEGEDSDAMSETNSSDQDRDLQEISRAEEAATTLQGLSNRWREGAARSIDPKKEITSESSGQASAMKLDSALADVKDDVKVGGRTGIQVRAPDSPDGGKVTARV